MCLRSYILLVALSFPFIYTKAEFRAGVGSSSSSVNIEDTSFVVGIYKNDEYHCVGSLVTLKHAITAFECLVLAGPYREIKVKSGINSISQTVQEPFRQAILLWCSEEDTGTVEIDIGIIQVHPSFDEDLVGRITLCKTTIQPGNQITVSGSYSRKESSYNIRSTLETLGEKHFFSRVFRGKMGAIRKMFYGFGSTCEVDPGAPGVVDGALCAVAGSYQKNHPLLYTDLSIGSRAYNYIKSKTECS